MRRSLVLLASALLATAPLAACGDDDPATTSTTDQTTTSTAAPGTDGSSTTAGGSSSSSSTTPGEEAEVLVYFARGEELGATTRQVDGPGVAQAALDALVAGPNDVEAEIGMNNAFPSGTEVLGVAIDDGVATVDLSQQFQSGGGSLTMRMRVAQIVFTLTQFDTVDSVDIEIDGEDVEGIGGEGVAATDLDRSDFEDLSPAILLESPSPGDTVTSPIALSGTANTFEANLLWSVVGDDGTEWGSGFGTATSGTGTRGTFSLEADVGAHTGPAMLKLWEESAEDGSEINVVQIPITVG